MLRTCFSTVPSVTHSWRAIPALERPSAISASTSRSRGAEHVERIVRPAGRDELLHQRRVDDGAAAAERSQRLQELVDVGDPALEQVAAALPAGQQVHRMLHLDVGRQHQDRDLGKLGPDDPGRVEALGRVVGRHPDVHDHQVGMLLPDRGEELGGVAGLGHHVEAGAIEQAGQALAEQDIIVRERYLGAAAAHSAHYRPVPGGRAIAARRRAAAVRPDTPVTCVICRQWA